MKTIIDGWVNLAKPLNMSSAHAVAIAKRVTNAAKVGHAGTLDPLATGILPLAFGKATKQVNLLMDARKTYHFSVTFGERRSTDDAEGEVIATSPNIPTEDDIRAILSRFTGEIEQTPPAFSALKVDGKRAYDLARSGQAVELKARKVTVYSLHYLPLEGGGREQQRAGGGVLQGSPQPQPSPLKGQGACASFIATVSKGTYIRSLGRDIAQALGSEGYISQLHRASVGPFTDANAISLDFLRENSHNPAAWLQPLFPGDTALDGIPARAS